MSSILSGVPRDATKGQGELKEVWLADFHAISGQTVVTTGTELASFTCPANTWKRYIFGKESASNVAEVITTNVVNASTSVEQTLTLVFRRNQASKRNEARVMANAEIMAICVDNNGDTYLYGFFNAMDQITSTSGSGNLYADANNLTLVLKALEPRQAPSIDPADLLLIQSGSAVV